MNRPLLLLPVLLLLLALAGTASAATGGAEAPAGGTGGSTPSGGGSTPTSTGGTGGATGGTAVDPNWVPSGAGRDPGGDAPAPSPSPSTPAAPDSQGRVRSFARTDIPPVFLKYYRSAGRKYGVDWRLLAALGKNETDHGRAVLPGVTSGLNFAACCSGPMQICQVASCGNVWQAYRRDGDGDGDVSIYDPADSIHSAAALVVDLRRMVGPNSRLIMAAYNAGPGNVQKYRGVPPISETITYVRNGVRYLRLLRG